LVDARDHQRHQPEPGTLEVLGFQVENERHFRWYEHSHAYRVGRQKIYPSWWDRL